MIHQIYKRPRDKSNNHMRAQESMINSFSKNLESKLGMRGSNSITSARSKQCSRALD